MNTTIDFINAAKAKTRAVSDYDLAKKMNMSRSSISLYQNGKRAFDDETALKVASILEIDSAIVLAAIHAERAKSETEKRAWTALFERLGGMAAAVVLGIGITTAPAPVKASVGVASHNTVYYVK